MKQILILTICMILSSCALVPGQRSEIPAATPTIAIATPISDSPAAGICAEHQGDLVTVTINPDIPDPRCSYVQPEQHLRVVNMRGETLKVTLAGLEAEIAPGEDYTFAEPFGALLMPGVHRFDVSPCCGAELILNASR